MLSWCCVTKNMVMSLLFLLFVGAISFLWILSPIDATLYFDGLGIFDCIGRACWSKCMCGQRTVDVLYRWIIELTIWAPRSQTSNEEKSHTMSCDFTERYSPSAPSQYCQIKYGGLSCQVAATSAGSWKPVFGTGRVSIYMCMPKRQTTFRFLKYAKFCSTEADFLNFHAQQLVSDDRWTSFFN